MPEGVKRKDLDVTDTSYIPEDEGAELFDGDGEDIPAVVDLETEIPDEKAETTDAAEGNETDSSVTPCHETSPCKQVHEIPDTEARIELETIHKFVDLLHQEKSRYTSANAPGGVLAFFNGLQAYLSNTKKKALADMNRKTNGSLISHLTDVACERQGSGASQCDTTAMEEQPMEGEGQSSEDTEQRTFQVGDYILIKCGEIEKNNLPGYIVRKNPTVVRFFHPGPCGLFSGSNEEYDIVDEDIVCSLCEPIPVQRASRLYFKFESLWLSWSTSQIFLLPYNWHYVCISQILCVTSRPNLHLFYFFICCK